VKTVANTFQIRGARGTTPACGGTFLRYGGHTTCFSIQTDSGWIVIDAGSGISSLSQELVSLRKHPPITILFTHLHMDHLIGLPTFGPLYRPETDITLMADTARGNWQDDLRRFIGNPFWPVKLADVDARLHMVGLSSQERAMVIHGIPVEWFPLPHPQQCLAFRFNLPDCRIVIATDAEYTADRLDPAFISFCHGADYLLFDAQYLPSEYPSHRDWGHSTWTTAVAVARQAGVRRLILTHHAPTRTDAEIDRILEQAREVFPATDAACETFNPAETAGQQAPPHGKSP
jgi:phosphoribosyl 1,2-cyclic phosphodiesterase